MTENIITHQVEGLKVGQRQVDGYINYINATRLAKAYFNDAGVRKDVRDWLNTGWIRAEYG